ncbi:acyl-CoA dehydrogenase family protein [Actinacidiphila glaucinigra]|uniref:acyl-CoA dehydrogenase family protein n=1 Tax=Actinacidiphila glaucinigra TaxID=235986 RepID=UPI0036E42446
MSSDLLYSDVENDLRATVRGLLADRCAPSDVLARCEGDEPYDSALWRTLAREVGVAGLLVPEKLGGQGASAREAAVVLEELGAFVAPVPFLGSAVLATTALLAAGTPEADPVVARLAEGEQTAALAVPLPSAPGTEVFPGVRADADGVLGGRVTSVADATAADVLIVPATGPDGPGLYEVRNDAPGVALSVPVPLDLTRPIADVTFDGAAGRRIAGPATAAAAVERALLAGAGLLASEQLGLAQRCLDETVAYLKERHQFGRVVGSFQSLKHRLADLWLEVVQARAAARNAADTLARDSADAPVAIAVAQAFCAPVAVRAAEECVQLHGGIGMTWEHPAHLRLKRAKADEIALGTPGRHRAALAALVELPAAG